MPEPDGKQYPISCLSLGLPVQAPILNRLGNMLFMNGIAPVKVRNSAGHLEDSGIGSRRKAEAVGDHIRKKRMDLGLLQREVAEIISVTVSSIYNWEHGTEPELQYNPSIIKFLGYIPFGNSISEPK